MYVSNRFRSRRRCDIEDESIEAVWVELRIKRRVILLGNVYRPPSSDASFMTKLEVMVEKAVSECKLVVLMGDFNVNLLRTSSQVEHLLSVTGSSNLTQLISKPTRVTDQSESLIYALFTSDTSIFDSTGACSVTGSDHMMIYGEMTIKVPAPVQISTIRSYKKCNNDEMLSDLESAPWHTMDTFDCIDDRWNYWKTLFLSIVNKHAPLIRVRRKQSVEGDQWIDQELRSLMRARNYYRGKFRKTHSQEDWNSFKSLKKVVKKRMVEAKTKHFENVLMDMSVKPKSTWRQLNAVLGRGCHRVIDSVTHNGKQLTGAANIANCFAQSFASALTFCVLKPLVCRVIPTTTRFKLTQIEEEVVLKKLLSLDVNKATGPHKISAKLLRMVVPSIFRSLALLFNYSISSGCFPIEWKEANVSAVPK